MPHQTLPKFRPSVKNTPPTGFYAQLGFGSEQGEDIVATIRLGVTVEAVDVLTKELGIPLSALLRLIHLPSATFTRRRLAKRLSPNESDRVYRIAKAYQSAVKLFEGDQVAAKHWLNEPAKALGGNTPLEHLDTEAGSDEVRDLIGRIEQGVIS